jgi:hypothetical protein
VAPPPKRRGGRTIPGGGRVTPKGTPPSAKLADGRTVDASSRYTPPIPVSVKVSPRWVPILMFVLLGLGTLVILLNYTGLILPGATDNWYLLVGLVCILGGIVTATNYH